MTRHTTSRCEPGPGRITHGLRHDQSRPANCPGVSTRFAQLLERDEIPASGHSLSVPTGSRQRRWSGPPGSPPRTFLPTVAAQLAGCHGGFFT